MASALASLLVAVGSIATGGVLLLRRWRSPSHRRCSAACFAVALWLGGSAIARLAPGSAQAARWASGALAAAAFLPTVAYWLAAGFGAPRRRHLRLEIAGWASSLVVAGVALQGGLVEGIRWTPWGHQPSYGALVWGLLLFAFFYWSMGLHALRRAARGDALARRSPAHRLLWAHAAAGLGAVDVLPGLGLPVHPLGFLPLGIYVLVAVRALGAESRALPDEAAREILAKMADGLLVCDRAGRVEIVNEALCSLSGYTRDVLLGSPMQALFSGSGEATFAGKRWKEQTVHEEISQLHTGTGGAIEVSVSISQLRGEEGRLLGAVVLVRDIRESRQAQLRLAESERRLAEAQRLARCGHWWWTGDELVMGSDELFRVAGMSPRSEGTPWRELLRALQPTDRRSLMRSAARALGGGPSFQHELRLALPEGEVRTIHVRGEVVSGSAGGRPTLAGTAQDVSERREAEKTMRALSKAIETTQVGITIADLQGTIVYTNPADAALHGYSVDELIGTDVGVLSPPDLRRPLREEELRSIGPLRRETLNLNKDGRRFPVELTSDVLTDAAGNPVGIVTSCLDITDRRKTEARFRNLLESAPDPMVIVDAEGIITLVNGRLEHELGYERRELLGQSVEVLLPERQRGSHPHLRAQYLANPVSRPMAAGLELYCRRKDGTEFPVEVSLSPASDADDLSVIAAIRDVSERKRLEQELARHAFYDSVTGLANRALLMDRLGLTLRRVQEQGGPPFAVLCVALERFDAVMASLGPKAGDELLAASAERLSAYALAGDTVAHVGGSVFVILVERLTGIADATRLADRILADIGRKTRVAGREIFAGASVGVVLAGSGYQRADELLRDAETAMQRARSRLGPGNYEIFDKEMHERALQRLELETDLRGALERGELYLEYQPIVGVASGRVQGAEALIRWRHPRRGVVAPSTLIPLAEETGMILPIGEWALGTACRQNVVWREAGLDEVFMAVNLSATQFRQRELPAMIRGVLRESGLEPARLELELTETVLMHDADLALDALRALQETGVGLCIDDFGVGHSSLSYLQRFPMSTLKVDRSFVADLGSQERADSMAASIIDLAHNLGLKAIAEGVEHERQLAALRNQACDEVQGYYFSPSVSSEDFVRFAKA